MNPYEMSEEESEVRCFMDDIRDMLLTRLSPLEKAALFNDYIGFRHLVEQEKIEQLYD
jgi:hypothetical protein